MSDLKNLPVSQHVHLKGRIDSVRSYSGNNYTDITTPAKDQFSRPSSFTIRSQRSLGQEGSVVEITCRLEGFIRYFNYKDKVTGANRQGSESTVTLVAVE